MATLPAKFEATRSDTFFVDPAKLTLVRDKEHYLYDPRVEWAFEEPWVLDIMDAGMEDPIACKREKDELLVVDGRQRVASTVEANKRLRKKGKEPILVRVFTMQGTESDMLGFMISSNEHRKENTIAVKANMVSRYLKLGRTKKDAAIRFGVSDQAISNWLSYLDLSAPVRKAVDEGIMTASAAAELKSLTPAEQKVKVDEIKATGTKVTAGAVRNVVAGKPISERKSRPSLKELQEVLEQPEIPGEAIALLKWVLGDLARAETEEVNPWLVKAVVPEETGRIRVDGKKK